MTLRIWGGGGGDCILHPLEPSKKATFQICLLSIGHGITENPGSLQDGSQSEPLPQHPEHSSAAPAAKGVLMKGAPERT